MIGRYLDLFEDLIEAPAIVSLGERNTGSSTGPALLA